MFSGLPLYFEATDLLLGWVEKTAPRVGDTWVALHTTKTRSQPNGVRVGL